MIINENDIIIIENIEFGRNYSGKVWINNFLMLRRAWRVDSISNNGTIHAHDMHGNKKLIHALDKPPCFPYIVKVIRN